MDDTDIPDSVLKQIPLIKNPSFQPPRPITLNSNYNKLLPNLSNKVIPPPINLSTSDLERWRKEIEEIRNEVSEIPTSNAFETWLKTKQLQIAPGFEFADNVMQPIKTKSGSNDRQAINENKSEVNELDEVFGKASEK